VTGFGIISVGPIVTAVKWLVKLMERCKMNNADKIVIERGSKASVMRPISFQLRTYSNFGFVGYTP
jgi:hypothetical protein